MHAGLANVLVALGLLAPGLALALDGAALWTGREDIARVASLVLVAGAALYALALASVPARGGQVGVALGLAAAGAFAASLLARSAGELATPSWAFAGAFALNALGNVLGFVQTQRGAAARGGGAAELPAWAPVKPSRP